MFLGDFAAWNIQNILIRVAVAAILGGVIGLDRGMKHRGAGTKTITVVCLGATLVMLTVLLLRSCLLSAGTNILLLLMTKSKSGLRLKSIPT